MLKSGPRSRSGSGSAGDPRMFRSGAENQNPQTCPDSSGTQKVVESRIVSPEGLILGPYHPRDMTKPEGWEVAHNSSTYSTTELAQRGYEARCANHDAAVKRGEFPGWYDDTKPSGDQPRPSSPCYRV